MTHLCWIVLYFHIQIEIYRNEIDSNNIIHYYTVYLG